MQWPLIAAALIVAVVGAATAIGWKLPPEHRTTREAEFRHGVDELWTALADFPSLPAWMPGIRRVQKLDAVDGRERWLYETAEGDMTMEVVARSAPTVLSIRTVNSDFAFGGTWTHRISPRATGSVLTVTEHACITNPFFRFMFRYVFGVASTPDEALTALGRYLGENVKPRSATPATV